MLITDRKQKQSCKVVDIHNLWPSITSDIKSAYLSRRYNPDPVSPLILSHDIYLHDIILIRKLNSFYSYILHHINIILIRPAISTSFTDNKIINCKISRGSNNIFFLFSDHSRGRQCYRLLFSIEIVCCKRWITNLV